MLLYVLMLFLIFNFYYTKERYNIHIYCVYTYDSIEQNSFL